MTDAPAKLLPRPTTCYAACVACDFSAHMGLKEPCGHQTCMLCAPDSKTSRMNAHRYEPEVGRD